jgi:hypothetical protein
VEFLVKSLAEFLVTFLVWSVVESLVKYLLSPVFDVCIDVCVSMYACMHECMYDLAIFVVMLKRSLFVLYDLEVLVLVQVLEVWECVSVLMFGAGTDKVCCSFSIVVAQLEVLRSAHGDGFIIFIIVGSIISLLRKCLSSSVWYLQNHPFWRISESKCIWGISGLEIPGFGGLPALRHM